MCVMIARTAVPWKDTGNRGVGGGAEAFSLLLGAPTPAGRSSMQERQKGAQLEAELLPGRGSTIRGFYTSEEAH